MDSLTATVDIVATELRTKEGFAKDFPSCRGYIVMRKTQMLRVAGTLFGIKVFDMASNGNRFTLLVPPRNLAFEGSTDVEGRSPQPMYNLRPGFFFDAMMVHGLDPDDYYSTIAETETVEDAAKKHLDIVPEYVLNITRHNPGSHSDTPVRVITFHRADLLPYQQDLYDKTGNLETEVFYANYTNFGGNKYPSTVTIKRPLEGIQLVLTVDRVIENPDNPKITDDQFQIKLPPDTKVQQLE